jgi:hypothetical protein
LIFILSFAISDGETYAGYLSLGFILLQQSSSAKKNYFEITLANQKFK